MECKEVIEKIDLYFEKRLLDIENHNIEEHLQVCKSCKLEYEEYENLFNLLSTHEVISPPADFTNSVMAKIEEINNRDKFRVKLFTNASRIGLSLVASGILIVSINISSLNYGLQELTGFIFKGSFEINQRITIPFGKMSQGLNYLSDFWSNNQEK